MPQCPCQSLILNLRRLIPADNTVCYTGEIPPLFVNHMQIRGKLHRSIRHHHQKPWETISSNEMHLPCILPQQPCILPQHHSGFISKPDPCPRDAGSEPLNVKNALDILDPAAVHSTHQEISAYSTILQACVNGRALKQGMMHHAQMLRKGLCEQPSLKAKLLVLYCKLGNVHYAHHSFVELPVKTLVTCTAMVAAYAQNGYFQEAIQTFYQMRDSGIQPNEFTYASVLPAFATLGDLEEGRKVHQEIVRCNLQGNVFVSTALIDMYVKCGCIDYARSLFDAMAERSPVTWNAMIMGYVQSGRMQEAVNFFELMPSRDAVSWAAMIAGYAQNKQFDEAYELFRQMQQTGLSLNSDIFTSVLPACRDSKDVMSGRQIHCYLLRNGVLPNVYVSSALLDAYAKSGFMEDAESVFDAMAERSVVTCNALIAGYVQRGSVDRAGRLFESMAARNVVSWTTVIAGHIQKGDFHRALDLFGQMLRCGLKPDADAYSSVLPACANCGSLHSGRELHADAVRMGQVSNVFVANSLLDMYAKCGNLDDACKTFERMRARNVVSWTAMIDAYGCHGCGKEALGVFETMLESGTQPNPPTFLAVLSACCHAGLVDEATRCFESMAHYCISPGLEHYSCIVDILGRVGLLNEAHDLIESMPMKPNAQIWGSLLNACIIHGDSQLGTSAADQVLKMEPENGAPYVALSNIYAAAGKRLEAENVRELMKQRKIQKMPGCSWIEVDKEVHAFVVG